jgi:hypothetical protein
MMPFSFAILYSDALITLVIPTISLTVFPFVALLAKVLEHGGELCFFRCLRENPIGFSRGSG